MLHASVAPQTIILAQSAVAASVTGTVTETALATVTIPAGSLGANGLVEVIAVWTTTNSANNKSLKVKLGSTAFLNVTATTTASAQTFTRAANRNSTSSQLGYSAGATGFSTSTGANFTASLDTTADVTLTITGTLTNTGETITLEGYTVRIYPKA